MRPVLAVFIFFGVLLSPEGRASQHVPTIVSAGGTGIAQIRRGSQTSDAVVGQSVPFGSIVQTGPANTLTIQYPDGSLVAIDADTRFEILERRDGMQPNALHSGQARGSIVKIKMKETQAKPRFMIRTKTAVMGVRGTEFVIALDSQGMATQVHTLEGVVDVAPNETALMGGNGVSVPSGKFVEATEGAGVSPAQAFDRATFEQSLKPAVPGGPAQMAFSGAGGATVLKVAPALPSLNDAPPPALDPQAPIDNRREPEDPKQDQKGPPPRAPESPKESGKSESFLKRARLISFQAAAYFLPPFKYAENPLDIRINGTGETIRALSLSWNPELPIPVLPFLSARGHLGVIVAQDGSLNNHFLIREYQVFGNFNFLGTFFAEVGWGRMEWPRRNFSSGIVSVNLGVKGFSAGAFSRIFVGHTQTLTDPPEESFRAGVGLEL